MLAKIMAVIMCIVATVLIVLVLAGVAYLCIYAPIPWYIKAAASIVITGSFVTLTLMVYRCVYETFTEI